MTLILNTIVPGRLIHYSDRLLSRQAKQWFSTFDANSNKTIVYTGADGYAVLGYTGWAYLDGIPTDTFIAQSLAAQKLSAGGAMFARVRPEKNVGHAARLLCVDLAGAYNRLNPDERRARFEVTIAGVRHLKRGGAFRLLPFLWHIHNEATEFTLVPQTARWWAWNSGYALASVPDVSSQVLQWLKMSLKERGRLGEGEVCAILAEAMRRTAEERPGLVGRSTLRVVVNPSDGEYLVRVALFVDPEDLAKQAILHAGFSPWVIAPGMVFAPAEIKYRGASSGWHQAGGNFSWCVEGQGALPDGSKFIQHSAIERPRRP